MEIDLFNNIFKNKKVIITGHTGFKGSWLSFWLLNLGAKVYGVSKDIPTKPSLFETLELEKEISHNIFDIKDLNKTKSLLTKTKPDFIFHLAAQAIVSKSYSDPIDTITTNVIGTTNVLESLQYLKNKCSVVIITSDKCYDNVEWEYGYREVDSLGGKDIYSGSKGAAELIFKSYFHSFFKNKISNITLATARAGNVIGGGDWAVNRIVPDCIKAWRKKDIVEIRSPNATRPWQHVLEPLCGYILLAARNYLNAKLNGESFNFGPQSESNSTVFQLIKDLSKTWNYVDINDAAKIHENKSFSEAGLLKLNCDKSLSYLKWKPVLNYNETIEYTGKWYFSFYNNLNNIKKITIKQLNDYSNLAEQRGIIWTKMK